MTSKTCRTVVAGIFAFHFSTSCFGGGDSWGFRIASVSSVAEDKFVLHLRPKIMGDAFPLNCEELRIVGEYETLYWMFKSGPTRSDHRAAIRLLEKASAEKSIVHFGWMGEGIGTSSTEHGCEARSRALAVLESSRGKAVFSFFKWP
jgi:hypothetical protein